MFLRSVSIFKVGLIFLHVDNLHYLCRGARTGVSRAFGKGGGGRGDRRSSLDFEQAFFLISSCPYYKEHQDFERNGYEHIMVGQIPPLQAIFAADLQAAIIYLKDVKFEI